MNTLMKGNTYLRRMNFQNILACYLISIKNLPPCIILEVGYLILLSSKILSGHFSKIKNVNGFYAITEDISCNKTMLSGAATIYPSGYSPNYIGMTYGISINNLNDSVTKIF